MTTAQAEVSSTNAARAQWPLHRWVSVLATLLVIAIFPIFTGLEFLQFGPTPYFLLVFLILALVVAWRPIKWVQLALGILGALFLAANSPFILPDVNRPDHYPGYVFDSLLVPALIALVVAAVAAFLPRSRHAPARWGSSGMIVLLLVAGLGLGATAASIELHKAPAAGAGSIYATPDATASTTTAESKFTGPVSIAANKLVKISVSNSDSSMHNFKVDALGISSDLPAGKSTDIWVKTDKTGTYQLYCSLHSEKGADGQWAGMATTFTVT